MYVFTCVCLSAPPKYLAVLEAKGECQTPGTEVTVVVRHYIGTGS